jgi:hypothetical protein
MKASSVVPSKRTPPGARSARGQKHLNKRALPSRTTVTLSADAAEIVKRFQDATGLSMSEAVSELIERSEPKPPRIKFVDGLPMADIPMDGKWITTEDILRAQAELG